MTLAVHCDRHALFPPPCGSMASNIGIRTTGQPRAWILATKRRNRAPKTLDPRWSERSLTTWDRCPYAEERT